MLLGNQKIQESSTLKINFIANQKKNLGEKVYNFAAGEPIVETPTFIIDGVKDAVGKKRVSYPPSAGLGDLIDLSADWFNKNFKCQYGAKETLITCGGKYAIWLSLQAILDPDDEVVIIAPYWVSYPEMIKIFGGKPQVLRATEENGWKIDISELRGKINSKTKAIIINNASNPTGHLFTDDELGGILNLAHEHDLYVISDEVYSGLTFDGAEFISSGRFEDHKDKLIVIQSCSKNFGMTGWRVGMVFAPQEIISCLKILQSQSITNTSLVSQWAAIEALRHAEIISKEIKNIIQKRRDIFVSIFNDLFPVKIIPPQAGLYAFVKISNLGVVDKKSDEFAGELIEQAGVAVTPGSGFGDDDYVRFSFGINESDIVEGLKAVKKHIDSI